MIDHQIALLKCDECTCIAMFKMIAQSASAMQEVVAAGFLPEIGIAGLSFASNHPVTGKSRLWTTSLMDALVRSFVLRAACGRLHAVRLL